MLVVSRARVVHLILLDPGKLLVVLLAARRLGRSFEARLLGGVYEARRVAYLRSEHGVFVVAVLVSARDVVMRLFVAAGT